MTQRVLHCRSCIADVRPSSRPTNISCTFHDRSSMGIEEQKEEREVLDSIFPDEITGTNEWAPVQEYTLTSSRHFRYGLPSIDCA